MKKRSQVNKAIKGLERVEEARLKKTLIFTFIFCLVVITIIVLVQLYGQNKISIGCSYLDPITIDFLAFFAALFLFIEGFARIFEHPNSTIKMQLTRTFRIAFGCAIMTLHIMQFLHK
ncbi:Uncharacterised protein [uncultured archaeon]|nr:Uncharacterised protein [uncultured archaeon]